MSPDRDPAQLAGILMALTGGAFALGLLVGQSDPGGAGWAMPLAIALAVAGSGIYAVRVWRARAGANEGPSPPRP